jgi:hypothetical protein
MIILNGQFNQALTSILQASGRYISLFKGNDKSPEQKKNQTVGNKSPAVY